MVKEKKSGTESVLQQKPDSCASFCMYLSRLLFYHFIHVKVTYDISSNFPDQDFSIIVMQAFKKHSFVGYTSA